jgi:hypothetical protein
MSTDQEYWDACLIKTWRNAGSVVDALQMYTSITGKLAHDTEPPLRRLPRVGYKYKLPIRIFMANHLEKISNRLFDQPPEKDVLLLQKLKDSTYTTAEKTTLLKDNELQNVSAQHKRDKTRTNFLKKAFGFDNRNRNTDWNVTK